MKYLEKVSKSTKNSSLAGIYRKNNFLYSTDGYRIHRISMGTGQQCEGEGWVTPNDSDFPIEAAERYFESHSSDKLTMDVTLTKNDIKILENLCKLISVEDKTYKKIELKFYTENDGNSSSVKFIFESGKLKFNLMIAAFDSTCNISNYNKDEGHSVYINLGYLIDAIDTSNKSNLNGCFNIRLEINENSDKIHIINLDNIYHNKAEAIIMAIR